jgi:hypothetical protein
MRSGRPPLTEGERRLDESQGVPGLEPGHEPPRLGIAAFVKRPTRRRPPIMAGQMLSEPGQRGINPNIAGVGRNLIEQPSRGSDPVDPLGAPIVIKKLEQAPEGAPKPTTARQLDGSVACSLGRGSQHHASSLRPCRPMHCYQPSGAATPIPAAAPRHAAGSAPTGQRPTGSVRRR